MTADQLEYKKLHFELAHQKSTENPWKFEHCLTTYYRAAQINDEICFVEIYIKGIFNDNLRKLLLLHNPALTTIPDLKAAIQRYQTSLLKYARSTLSLAASVTTGLGAMLGEDSEIKKKTLKKIQDLQKQLVPSSMTGKGQDSTNMEIDTMFQRAEEEDKGTDEESSCETSKSLFFMEPDHEEFRETEDQETQEYWEAGITKECLNVLRSGGVDHLQKQCYHFSHKEYIKANCPERRKLGTQPWKKRS